MPCNSTRNLDIPALQSFVTVAELGGVTRAERLNLTQSAVSMQLKRLETAFDQPLMQRYGRGVCLTSEGEQLLGYGRRMVKLNDETWNRMMHEAFESRVSFGVPEDIVRPYVTGMLREFVGAFPRADQHGVVHLAPASQAVRGRPDRGDADHRAGRHRHRRMPLTRAAEMVCRPRQRNLPATAAAACREARLHFPAGGASRP